MTRIVLSVDNITSKYDDYNRIIDKQVSKVNKKLYSVTYDYLDVDNTITSSVLKKESIKINNDSSVICKEYEMDIYGKIKNIKNYSNQTLIKEENYIYDTSNNLTKALVNKSGSLLQYIYQYDTYNNIIKIINPTRITTLEYDNTLLYKLNKVNGVIVTYDSLGFNIIGYGTRSLSYLGRQISSIVDTNLNATYEYNSVNLRTRKVVNNNETKYYYDQGRLSIEETNSYKKIYFYDNDAIVGFDYYKNGTITRYYLLRDATKLVIALLKEDGTIIEQYDYDPFGNILNDLTNISKINYILYKGYYFDFESGYYYCNSRYYNPKWCRWMSPDAIDYLDSEVLKGLNLYAYCENDPVNKYDPSGHIVLELITGSTAIYYLLAALGIITIASTSFLTSHGVFKNENIGIPLEWQIEFDYIQTNVLHSFEYISGQLLSWMNSLNQSFGNYFSFDINNCRNYSLSSWQDPYGRAGQKKQGRELKNKARTRFDSQTKFRNGRKPPKKHTPGKGHKKYLW